MRRRALLSVTDKTSLQELATGLVGLGFEILSTGGTAKALRDAGLNPIDVAEVTGFPEMLDGRIKTLHPKVHGALLGDVRSPAHREQMAAADIVPIELLCVNLYAFEETVRAEHTFEEAIESIDIGGPAMLRAAAKNQANVTVLVDPADYASVLDALASGEVETLRPRLAAKAFRHTAFYDSMVSRYLSEAAGASPFERETLTLGWRRRSGFRYGENPHQSAALFEDPFAAPGIAQARQLWGKELSFNNVGDADAAWQLVADLPAGACVIVKHGNPCGAARGNDLADSYRQARESDPVSAFGGIAAFHGSIDVEAARAMTERGNFLEVVVGHAFSPEALEIFKHRSGWGQDVRLLSVSPSPATPELQVRSVGGGVVLQERDVHPERDWEVATLRPPSDAEMQAMRFLWSIVPHVKSNAIVVGSGSRLFGVGAGQMNRVQSVRLALEQAGAQARGAALASDAFFPFPDSIEAAAKAGITAVVQPGGSKKDGEVIACADELGLAMCLTGVRHFRH